MLTLKRKSGRSLIIDDDIELSVLEINGAYISLGVDAPEYVIILREELCRKESEKDTVLS